MPIRSKRQNRFFRAHAKDKGELGKVAREFIASTPKGAFKNMPESASGKSEMRREAFYGKD